MRYVADTYAWISYFSRKRFRQIIENELIETPAIVIAELGRTLKRKRVDEKMIEKILQFVSRRGLILPLDFESAKKGGRVAEEEGLSLIDGIIYSYVSGDDCRLITGDEHFRGKKNVIFEKE
ncbi:MAG: PIN domain-containing protein [Candidatus Micrarchaeota archaeon]